MPPPKGPAKHFNGEAQKAFEGIGHGRRILFADPSLDLPAHTEEVVGTHAGSAAEALFHYAQFGHLEPGGDGKVEVVCMAPDPSDKRQLASIAIERFRAVAFKPIVDLEGSEVKLDLTEVPRETIGAKLGFYALMTDTSKRLLVVRTSSRNPYDCAYVESGHAQTGDEDRNQFELLIEEYRNSCPPPR